MKPAVCLMVVLSFGSVFCFAGPQQMAPASKHPVAVDAKYDWNTNSVAKIEALKLKADINHGRDLFIRNCLGCHLQSGSGKTDGTYPQLAGQHANVLIKQISDIKAGLRTNPKMRPHTIEITSDQDLADVTTYISLLDTPHDNGKNSRNPAVLKKGEALYKKDCLSCHGPHGEGAESKLFPVLAGQHYKYLLRQMKAIQGGERKNGLPEMIAVIKNYSAEDLDAIASYTANLKMPTRFFPPTPTPASTPAPAPTK